MMIVYQQFLLHVLFEEPHHHSVALLIYFDRISGCWKWQKYTLHLDGDISKRVPMEDLRNKKMPPTLHVVKGNQWNQLGHGGWSIINNLLHPWHIRGKQNTTTWTGVSIQPTILWSVVSMGLDFISSQGPSGSKGIHGRLSAGPADPAGESPGFQARL